MNRQHGVSVGIDFAGCILYFFGNTVNIFPICFLVDALVFVVGRTEHYFVHIGPDADGGELKH